MAAATPTKSLAPVLGFLVLSVLGVVVVLPPLAGHDDGDGIRNNIAIGVQFLAINNVGFINVLLKVPPEISIVAFPSFVKEDSKLPPSILTVPISSYIALEITILNNKLMSIMDCINAAA